MKIFASLRSKMLILTIIAVALPMLFSGFVLIGIAGKSTVAEKQQKLFGAAHILDLSLQGTFDDILRQHGKLEASREEKIRVLNLALREYTDLVASAYPGIGVGYYSKDLDAIITYGPSNQYGNTVGMSISENHEGRLVMATGQPRVQVGNLVRGTIMNAMHPIIRDGQVIGYIWSNELMEDIRAQLWYMRTSMFMIIALAVIVGIIASTRLIDSLAINVERIKKGVNLLKENLNNLLPVQKGEFGEIALAVNDLARELQAKKLLEEQVRHAERLELVGEVAAGLAHEIRNPLMAIRGFAQLVQENEANEEAKEFLNVIVRESDRMDHLIEELLCLSRPVSTTVITPVNVNKAVERVLLLMINQARKHNIILRSSLAPDLPEVMAEEEQLKQVVLNVLINAIQAVEKDGIIDVSTSYDPDKESVAIRISDTGKGIDPDIMERIFTPFFTTKEKGTGLGLAVVQHQIENWGGKVLVDSTLGQGSTFTLILPVGRENNE